MAQPIYKVFLCKPTEAMYQLSEEERNRLFAKVGEALGKVGAKQVLLCASLGSEQWGYFGFDLYPDIEALQKYTELLNEFNWFRYMEAMTVLGTEMPTS